MSVDATINNLNKYLAKDESFIYLVGRARDTASRTIFQMGEHVKKALQGESGVISEEEANDVKVCLDILIDKAILEELDNDFKFFINEYLMLCFNWNKLAGIQTINTRIKSIKVFLEYQNSVNASILVMKRLLKEFGDLKNFRPAAFDLSRHYLETIQERFNQRGCGEEC